MFAIERGDSDLALNFDVCLFLLANVAMNNFNSIDTKLLTTFYLFYPHILGHHHVSSRGT